jgi:hypothetical protein
MSIALISFFLDLRPLQSQSWLQIPGMDWTSSLLLPRRAWPMTLYLSLQLTASPRPGRGLEAFPKSLPALIPVKTFHAFTTTYCGTANLDQNDSLSRQFPTIRLTLDRKTRRREGGSMCRIAISFTKKSCIARRKNVQLTA